MTTEEKDKIAHSMLGIIILYTLLRKLDYSDDEIKRDIAERRKKSEDWVISLKRLENQETYNEVF